VKVSTGADSILTSYMLIERINHPTPIRSKLNNLLHVQASENLEATEYQ